MYGLVNRAIQTMVVAEHDESTWDRIRRRAGVEELDFVSMHAYDDSITYDLVGAAAAELAVEAPALLRAFGRYWIQFSAAEGYGDLLQMWGQDLPTFLAHLDDMHARVGLSFPQLRPPSFRVLDLGDRGLEVRYFSDREGLAPFVIGLLEGLAERFGESVEVTHERTDGDEGFQRFVIHRPTQGAA